MDISNTTEPKSDQQNFDDYANGSKTVTISEVRKGSAEQPVELHLVEYPGRPYKPGKSMRRVLVACWGAEASVYVGRTMKLYGDPDVKFGGSAVGGIRIEALSHIDKPVTISLTITRAKRAPFVVQPLEAPKDTSGRDWLTELTKAGGDASAIAALGKAAKTANAKPAVLDIIRDAYHEAHRGDNAVDETKEE